MRWSISRGSSSIQGCCYPFFSADMARAKHAAGSGLTLEQIKDELLKATLTPIRSFVAITGSESKIFDR
jgi:hypothetical protein